MIELSKKCPDCFKALKEGYNGLFWCLCGYKRYPKGYGAEGPDRSLLSQVFVSVEIEKLNRLDLAELKADKGLSVCPFPKGERAGIRCQKIIMAKRKNGGWMRICPVPSGECVYHG